MKVKLLTEAQFSHSRSKTSGPATVCELQCTVVGLFIPFNNYTANRLKPLVENYNLRVDMTGMLLFETTGVVHLKEGDTSSYETAEKYAESKAVRKAYKVVLRITKMLQPEYARLESALCDARDNFLDYLQHEEQHIEELKKK